MGQLFLDVLFIEPLHEDLRVCPRGPLLTIEAGNLHSRLSLVKHGVVFDHILRRRIVMREGTIDCIVIGAVASPALLTYAAYLLGK